MVSQKILNRFFDGRNIYIVSDLHLGDGSGADNFKKYKNRFSSFLDMVEEDQGSRLIINGDTFEFWQSRVGDVVAYNFDLLRRLIRLEAIFIVGNHDVDLLGFTRLPLNRGFWKHLVTNVELKRNDMFFDIMHGHQFDPFNNPDKSEFVGKMMSLLTADLERKTGGVIAGVEFERWSQRNIEPIGRKLFLYAMKIYNLFFYRRGTEVKELDFNKAYDSYHEKYPNRILISGHTHRPGLYRDFYYNTGCWDSEHESHYIKIEPDGNFSLYNFPQNQPVRFEYQYYEFF